jgi:hypothetical protein
LFFALTLTGDSPWVIRKLPNDCVFVTANKVIGLTGRDSHIRSLVELFVRCKRYFHIVYGTHGLKDGSVMYWIDKTNKTPQKVKEI